MTTVPDVGVVHSPAFAATGKVLGTRFEELDGFRYLRNRSDAGRTAEDL